MQHSFTSKLKLAGFERTLDSFIAAATMGHTDQLKGMSESLLVGNQISMGTGGSFSIIPQNLKTRQTKFRASREVRISRVNATTHMPFFSMDATTSACMVRRLLVLPSYQLVSTEVQTGTALTSTRRKRTTRRSSVPTAPSPVESVVTHVTEFATTATLDTCFGYHYCPTEPHSFLVPFSPVSQDQKRQLNYSITPDNTSLVFCPYSP
jgi:hypothetical protein